MTRRGEQLKPAVILVSIALLLNFCDSRQKSETPNIIFISMDTTRYDYIDTGYGARATTPALKKIAGQSITFKRAFVTIPETLPSHLSIFTSQYPHDLGVIQNHSRFNACCQMIQEILKENGYTTYGITSLMSLIEPGFWKGFDEFNRTLCPQETGHLFVTADKIFDEGKKKLAELHKKKFFMFIHFSDPHFPYGPPTVTREMSVYLDGLNVCRLNAYKGMILPSMKLKSGIHQLRFEMSAPNPDFSGMGIIELTPDAKVLSKSGNIRYRRDVFSGCYFLSGHKGWISLECQPDQMVHLQILPQLTASASREMYRREVEYMDRHIGLFLNEVKRFNLFDRTIIAIFSDHGEGLGERENYFGHVEFLNSQFIRVPLLLVIPGEKPREIEIPVSLSGLSSTILDYLSIPARNFQNSFLDLIRGEKSAEREVLAFTYHPNCKSNKIAFIQWPFQGIYYWNEGFQTRELYNLGQSKSFSASDQISRKNFTRKENSFFSLFINQSIQLKNKISSIKPDDQNINRKKLENLRRLGYIR